MQEVVPSRKYNKRKSKDLTIDDHINILYSVRVEYKSHAEVARIYRISVPLVGRIIKRTMKNPGFINKLKAKHEYEEVKRWKIRDTITTMT